MMYLKHVRVLALIVCSLFSAELLLHLLSLTSLVTSGMYNSFLTLLLALNKHQTWCGSASVRSLINQMLRLLVLNGADSNPAPSEVAGGTRKSLHNRSFRKSINGRGGRLHNRLCASLIT